MCELSIIIVTYNSADDIGDCLDSIEHAGAGLDMEVFVIDNASADGTAELVRRRYPHVRLIANERNEGFSPANNQAIALSRGQNILLLNPDTIVHRDALGRMVQFMKEHPDVGVCGPRLLDKDGVEAPHLRKPSLWLFFLRSIGLSAVIPDRLPHDDVEVVSGACMNIRASLIPSVGLLDPDLFWFEDVDYCLRVRSNGFLVRIVPDAHVTHLVGRSGRSNLGLMIEKQYTSKILYYRKNRPRLESYILLLLNEIQIVLRLARWLPVRLLRRSQESIVRTDIFFLLLRSLPGLIRRS